MKKLASTALIATSFLAVPAFADTINGTIFNNIEYQQTSNNAASHNGYFFSLGADHATGFTSASATYPGPGSPKTLDPSGAGAFNYGSPLFTNQPDLQAAYPTGTYIISATGPSGSTSVPINYTQDLFTATLPLVTNFSSLNGADPTKPIPISFNGFSVPLGATEGFTFFSVGTFDAGFLSNLATGTTITANALAPNTTYEYQLDYSVRVDGAQLPNGDFEEQGFDKRTLGFFTTGVGAVPEPSTWAMMILGFFGIGFMGYRRKDTLTQLGA